MHILLTVFEVRLMRKYDFSLDTIPVSVITLDAPLSDRSEVMRGIPCGGYAVMIYPVSEADLGVTCIDKNEREPGEPHIAMAALLSFFKAVRRLPDVTLDMLYRAKVYEISIGTDEHKFSVNVGKCKFICAKTVDFDDGIMLSADVVDCDGACVSTVCHDSECFCVDRLARLSALSGLRRDAPAVAVSCDTGIRVRSVGGLPFYSALSVALGTLCRGGYLPPVGIFDAFVDGVGHRVSCSAGRLTFYPDIKYLY